MSASLRRVLVALCTLLAPGLLSPGAGAQYPPVAPEAGDVDVRLSGAGVAGYVPGVDSAITPEAVTTADGALHVVWLDYRTFDPSTGPRWSVLYRRVQNWQTAATPSGLVLGPEMRLSTPSLNATRLSLATNGVNLVACTWIEIDGPQEAVRARQIKLSGNKVTLGNLSTLNTALLQTPNAYVGPPEIACVRTPAGKDYAYVTWAQYDGTPGSGGGLAAGYDQVYFARSQNGGQSWSGPASVADTLNLERSTHHEGPRLAADRLGGVYVTFLDTRLSIEGVPAMDLFVRASTNFGVQFGPETQLSRACTAPPCTPTSFAAVRPSITAAGNGTVGVAWIDASCSSVGQTRMRARRSLDLGGTWECEATIGRASGLMLHVDTDIAASSDGTLWAAWARADLDVQPLLRPSVFVAPLQPASGSWGVERRVSVGGAQIGTKGTVPPLPRPRVVADPQSPSRALVTWMHTEAGFEQEHDVVASWTTDGGATWHAPSALVTETGPDAHKTRAAYPVPVLAGPRAGVLWDDRRHWTNPIVTGLPLPPGSPLGAPSVYFNWIDLGSAGVVP